MPVTESNKREAETNIEEVFVQTILYILHILVFAEHAIRGFFNPHFDILTQIFHNLRKRGIERFSICPREWIDFNNEQIV